MFSKVPGIIPRLIKSCKLYGQFVKVYCETPVNLDKTIFNPLMDTIYEPYTQIDKTRDWMKLLARLNPIGFINKTITHEYVIEQHERHIASYKKNIIIIFVILRMSDLENY